MKQLKFHGWTVVVFLLASVIYFSEVGYTQQFPNRPVTVVVPKEAGGAHDVTARALASVAQKYLGQPMYVELKPGGGGAIGADFVAKQAPDGYTVLFGDSGVNSAKPAESGRSKGPNDMEAVCVINFGMSPILVRADAPFKTFKEFMDYAKAHPNELKYGSAGTASWNEMAWKLFEFKTGIRTRIVPYEGGGPALIALLGGHVDVTCTGVTASISQIKAGKIRIIVFFKDKRPKSFPDIPIGKEFGVDVNNTMWKGMLVPKGTPRPVIEKLAMAFKKMTEDKAVIQTIERSGDELDYLGPDEFSKMWRKEYEDQKEILKMLKSKKAK